jgi:hypothetical protein
MSKPHDEPEVTTYFQLQRNRDGLPDPGEDRPGGDVSQLPPLPANSPWGSGPGPGREELIDRTEDAATGGPDILEVDQ